jgi:hypothetical protein
VVSRNFAAGLLLGLAGLCIVGEVVFIGNALLPTEPASSIARSITTMDTIRSRLPASAELLQILDAEPDPNNFTVIIKVDGKRFLMWVRDLGFRDGVATMTWMGD